MGWLSILLDIAKGLFGAWLSRKTDVAKEAGAAEQKVQDQGVAYEQATDAARAAADAAQRVREQLPSANNVVPPTADIYKDNPDIPIR